MLRAGRKSAVLIRNVNNQVSRNENRRHLSNTGTSGGSGLRNVVVVGSVVAVAFGSTVAYANSNQKFRNQVETSIPGSKTVLDAVIGKSSEAIALSPSQKPKKVSSDPFEKPMLKKEKTATKTVKVTEEKNNESSISSVLEKQDAVAISALTTQSATDSKVSSNNAVEESTKPITTLPVPEPEISKPEVIPNANVLSTSHDTKPDSLSEVKQSTVEIKQCADTANIKTDVSKQASEEKKVAAVDKKQDFDSVASAAILKELLSGCSDACANAILSNNAAANAIAFHSSLLRTALDDTAASAKEKSLQWMDVGQALVQKEKRLEEANNAYHRAIEELTKIKQVMEQTSFEDPFVKETRNEIEQTCMFMSKDLEEAKSKVSLHIEKADSLSKYQQLVEDAKSNLRAQLSLPEGKVEEEWRRQTKKLNESEDMEGLIRMHHDVEKLQKQLEEERVRATKHLEDTILTIRIQTEEQVKSEAKANTEALLEDLRYSFEKKIDEFRQIHEEELKRELKKQNQAHAEHLANALSYMDKQAAIKYEKVMKEEVEKQEKMFLEQIEERKAAFENQASSLMDKHQFDLNVALARIEGIKHAISGRAVVESESRKAQELSLACDSLMMSIKYGANGKPTPLKTEVETVKKVYSDNPSIEALSNSLSMEAENRGVYPEEILRTSFQRVATSCRRVSMVDEERNSLFMYFLSYLKSLLTISNASLVPPTELEESKLGVFEILSYATYCVQHGDIEQAVRFINQLKGEPRRVAEGWMKEARLFLETKQTVEALCAISSSIVLGAQLEQ